MTRGQEISHGEAPVDRSVIVVEDDKFFAQRLMRARAARGFSVMGAQTVEEAIEHGGGIKPAYNCISTAVNRIVTEY